MTSSSIETTFAQVHTQPTTAPIALTTPSDTTIPEITVPETTQAETIAETSKETTVTTIQKTVTPTPKPATPTPTTPETTTVTTPDPTVAPTTAPVEAWMEAFDTSANYTSAMQYRADHGYESISRSDTLDALAQGRAEELAILGELNHNNMPNEANWEGLTGGINGGYSLYGHCADGFAATSIGIGAATYHRADGSTYSVTCMLLKK